MEERKITVDGIELTPVWQVLYQDAWKKRCDSQQFWVLENPKASARAGWVGKHTFKSKADAVEVLSALIRDRSRGARTETQKCGDFGIDLVIDEDEANDMRIVNWKIRKQYKSAWELDGQMEVTE